MSIRLYISWSYSLVAIAAPYKVDERVGRINATEEFRQMVFPMRE